MRVLIIEDEKPLARVIEVELILQGMRVTIRNDGKTGLAAALEGGYDLLILDWMLPDVEGIDVCRALRAQGSKLPIIMITAKQGVSDEVRGLQEGADDYIVKPFDMELLLARISAVVRRSGVASGESVPLSYGELVLNDDEHAVYKNGRPVHLTKKEFEILRLLMSRCGKVLSKDEIFTAVWGDRVHLEEGILAVHVKAIRKKLGGRYIDNVRGIGYLLPKECPSGGEE
ncbi:MAG: response regulator transcription factor [Treponemataceae bacterium]